MGLTVIDRYYFYCG